MKNYLFITIFTVVLAISGCATNSQEELPVVDVRSLLRSMIYTERELLTIELAKPTPYDNVRYTSLLKSYCDLADREMILITSPSKACEQPITAKERLCLAKFYQDVRKCNFRQGQCTNSELALSKCRQT